jgi:hypothetical protein
VSREPGTRAPAGRRTHPASPRPAARPAAARPVSRHQASRHEREQHYQRLTLIGAGIIVLIVLVLLGVGWYQSYVRPLNQTVVTVGNMHADMRYYIKRIRELIPQFANSDPQTVVAVVPESATDLIQGEFILIQRAGSAGITASNADVDQAIQEQLGILTVNGVPPNRGALESALRNKLQQTGLTMGEYRQEQLAQVLRARLQAKLGDDYPKTGPGLKYDAIIANKEDDAKALLAKLDAGQSWDEVAASVRANQSLGTVAEFDTQPKILLDDKLGDALMALSPGQHTPVINTAEGKFQIGMLVNKDPQFAIDQDKLRSITPKLFAGWMDEQRKTINIKTNLSDEQKLFALAHSGWQPSQQQQNTAPQPGTGIQTQPQLPPGIATPPGGLVPPALPPSSGTTP